MQQPLSPDLAALQRWYAENLCGRLFVFTLANGRELRLIFGQADFAHLLGIHHIESGKYFRGANAW